MIKTNKDFITGNRKSQPVILMRIRIPADKFFSLNGRGNYGILNIYKRADNV